MTWAMDIAFYAGTAFYLAAGFVAVRYLLGSGDRPLALGNRLVVAGAACLVAAFLLRWGAWGRVPLTTITDSLNLLTVLSSVVMLWLLRRNDVPALLCFYLPPLAVLCLVNATVAHRYLHEAPRELRGIPLTIHVGLAFLAYALFLLASMTSAAYIFQARHLKRRRTTGLFQRLPSLEQLDRTLCRLVSYGYPLFVITLVLGGAWAWLDRDLLGARWWLAPKIVLSCVMAAFYAVTFHTRRSGRLRGPKLAYVVFFGFSSLLVVYLVLALMNLRAYHFWGSGA